MKTRIDIRKRMKAEKKAIHALEAEQIKKREEREAHTGEPIIPKPVNFHRPVSVMVWNAPKRKWFNWMCWPKKLTPRTRRSISSMQQQLRENNMVIDECESDSVETCEVIVEMPMPKVTVQKRIRPGGRVERRMRRLEQERMEEDVANAKEFAKAVCEMHITPKMLREQKGDNL